MENDINFFENNESNKFSKTFYSIGKLDRKFALWSEVEDKLLWRRKPCGMIYIIKIKLPVRYEIYIAVFSQMSFW